jgi:hypothetical protein
MEATEYANKFGKLLIEYGRDNTFRDFLKLTEGKFKDAENIKLSNELKDFTPEQLETVKKLILLHIDDTIHNFLWMIEQNNEDFDIVVKKDGEWSTMDKESDGLYGESYGEDGWIAKYSKYYSPNLDGETIDATP